MSQPASDRKPIDFAALVQRCMGDPQFAREMLRLFAEQAPPMVADLRAALLAGDLTRAAHVAHALKGAAANAAAMPLSESVAAVETLCRDKTVAAGPAAQAMERVNEALTRCLSEIVDAGGRSGPDRTGQGDVGDLS